MNKASAGVKNGLLLEPEPWIASRCCIQRALRKLKSIHLLQAMRKTVYSIGGTQAALIVQW